MKEIGSRNNVERMMVELLLWRRRKRPDLLCWRRSVGERVDKDDMRVLEEVRRNKSTEKRESTSGTVQEVAIYHFTQMTNVALLLFPCFCCHGLAASRGYSFLFKECHLNRLLFVIILLHLFYLHFFKFSFSKRKKKKIIFFVQLKGDIVCILHVSDGIT